MIWFTFAIPIITVLILLAFFRKKVVLWEYAVVVFPSIILILFLEFVMIHARVADTEYLGESVVSAKYYEDWNERVSCRHPIYCTRKCGKNCITSYVCGHHHLYDVDYHPEYWVMVTSSGNEIRVSHDYYTYLTTKFATQKYFVDMHRDYHTDDGDAYETDWGNTAPTSHSVTYTGSYENKIKASHSVFKLEDITPEEAVKHKLYEYPDVNGYDQDVLLGYNQSESENNLFHYINGAYGKKHQFRVFVVVFNNNDPRSIMYKQRSYWEGGNKNEFIICVGLDKQTSEVKWAKTFSWMDVPTLGVDTDDFLNEQQGKKLDVIALGNFLIQRVPTEWKRKDFHDFDYLKIEVTGTQLTWIIIIVTIGNVLISIWVVGNEFHHEEDKSKFNLYKRY